MPLLMTLIFLLVSGSARAESVERDPDGVDLKKPVRVRVTPPASTSSKPPAGARPLDLAALDSPSPPPPELQWGGALDYRLRTDLADKAKPRLYVHTLDFNYGFEHTPSQLSVGANLGAAYESVGDTNSEILVNSNEAELFVNDVAISVEKTWNLNERYRLAISGSNEFPTSPDARREGYNSVTTLGVSWPFSWFGKKLSTSVSSDFNYIWNSYRYSPATADLNKQMGWKVSLGFKYKIVDGWSIHASTGSQLSYYLDGTADRTYRSSIGTSYAWSRFSLSLGYSNGTYLNQEDATLWYVDQYRRTASLGMHFQF